MRGRLRGASYDVRPSSRQRPQPSWPLCHERPQGSPLLLSAAAAASKWAASKNSAPGGRSSSSSSSIATPSIVLRPFAIVYSSPRRLLKQFLSKEPNPKLRTEKQLLLAVFSLSKSSQVPTPTGWQLVSKQPGVFCQGAVSAVASMVFCLLFWKSKQIGAYWFRNLISTQYIIANRSSSDPSWCVQCKLLNIHWRRRFFNFKLKK